MYFIDRDIRDVEPVSAVGAFDPDARVALQGAPLRLVGLSDADQAGSNLNDPGCRTDVEDFVVARRQLLVECLRDV